MTTVSVADLAKRLPGILQALSSGEEFLVMEAGQPVARILPALLPESRQAVSNEQWQRDFAAWMKRVEARADRYPPGFAVDDSYEAIYGERENAQR